MIELRFWKLPKLMLLYDANDPSYPPGLPDMSNAFMFFPGFIADVDNVIEVLNEIERAYDADVAANPWVIRKGEFSAAASMAYRPREMWRIGSYIMFATTLERVIEKKYESLLAFVGDWDSAVRDAQVALHAQARLDRKAEMKPILALRNKVFAHTAWDSPRPQDSPAVQQASLQFFAGGAAGFSDDGMHFGGYYLGENGEDSDKLPRMSMRWLLDNYPPHLAAWHQMCADVCERLRQVPDETIKRWAPRVHTVHGRPVEPEAPAADSVS